MLAQETWLYLGSDRPSCDEYITNRFLSKTTLSFSHCLNWQQTNSAGQNQCVVTVEKPKTNLIFIPTCTIRLVAYT